MDKKTFIRELERSLSVLQEDELKDIIGEYEQHIDMKVQRGLTEEEAIEDFGSISQLTSEILEAYHVRADYAGSEKEKGKKFSFAGGEKAGREILEQTGELCAKTGHQTVRGLKRVGAWLWGVLLFWKDQIQRPFGWLRRKLASHQDQRWARMQQEADNGQTVQMQQEADNGQAVQMQDTGAGQAIRPQGRSYVRRAASGRKSVRGFMHSAVSALAGLVVGIFRLCVKAAGWCIRVAWNICWGGFSLFCGFMGLVGLFVFGMLAVLLTQGYPLAGVVIGCLGLNLCLFAAAGLGVTFLWRSRKEPAEREAAQEPEQDQEAEVGRLEVREHA